MNVLTSVRGRRTATGAAALALVAAACAACVGGSTPSSGTSTGQGGVTTTTSGAPTSPGTSTSAATTAAATTAAAATTTAGGGSGGGSGSANSSGGGSGPTTCQTGHLAGSIGSTEGAAGSAIVTLVFENTGSTPCTLTGYPGVSFGAGKPVAQLGQPAARDPLFPTKTVTLIPGAHAFTVLQVGDAGNWPASTCDPAPTTYLRIYPPNNSTLLYVPYTSTGCLGDIVTLHVRAVQPGAGASS